MKAATIKDVAKRAGVSTTTVSRVLRGEKYVSAELKQRVEDAIRDLNYHPNISARSLKTNRSYSIALIVPDLANPFYANVAKGIESFIYEQDYVLLVCNTEGDHLREREFLRLFFREQKACGAIISGTSENTDELIELTKMRFPIVLIDNKISGLKLDCVCSDNKKGGYIATKYLLMNGHRRIGFIAGPLKESSAQERFEGYQAALSDAGIPVDRQYFREGKFQYESGYKLTKDLVLSTKPTALFVSNNMMGFGALAALKELHQDIPQDISLIVFDDSPQATLVDPPLTTIKQDDFMLGRTAAKLLIKRLAKPEIKYREIILEPELIIRQSCRKI